MLAITPSQKEEVTHIACPHCGEKLPKVGLKKNSKIDGLLFKCRKCQRLWELKSK